MEYLLVSLCECEANKISFSSCLQQPVIHLSNGCSSKVVMPGSSPAFWSCQDPPQPSGHARILPGLLIMPGSSPVFLSCQDPPRLSGHARILPGLLVMPGSFPVFWSCQAPPQSSCHAKLLPSLLHRVFFSKDLP